MGKTIKEIYGWDLIKDPETNLLKHVNDILLKTPMELDVSDVGLMVRQEIFLDLAIPKAISFVKNDSSAGDHPYQLLENLSKLPYLSNYKNEIKVLLKTLEAELPNIEFELDEEKDDFCESLERLRRVLNK